MIIFQKIKHHIVGLSWVLLLACSCLVEAGDDLTLSSVSQPRILVELYTSEGCSSCPPAEASLNDLLQHEALWKTYIPIAFHVDYWDYIGWRDPYAHPAHGKRQSQYARHLKQNTVYTPAFMVNGKPWLPGSFDRKLPDEGLKGGELHVHINGTELVANYLPLSRDSRDLELHVAVLGMGLSSQITAGENRGRRAEHEFVVVGYRTRVSSSSEWRLELPRLHYVGAKEYAIAVWVSHVHDPMPLQTVGGNLPQGVAGLLD